LTDTLREQSTDNPERIIFDYAIRDMDDAEEVTIET
jgi:hypothetical protein